MAGMAGAKPSSYSPFGTTGLQSSTSQNGPQSSTTQGAGALAENGPSANQAQGTTEVPERWGSAAHNQTANKASFSLCSRCRCAYFLNSELGIRLHLSRQHSICESESRMDVSLVVIGVISAIRDSMHVKAQKQHINSCIILLIALLNTQNRPTAFTLNVDKGCSHIELRTLGYCGSSNFQN